MQEENSTQQNCSVEIVGRSVIEKKLRCSADERLQSLRREGWRNTWMATVLRSGDEIAVVFPNGEYFRGRLENPPNLAPAGQSLAASALFGERCLVCNGLGGHEEGCLGTSAYDELQARNMMLESLIAEAPKFFAVCDFNGEKLDWLKRAGLVSPNTQAEARRRKPMTMKNEQDSEQPAIPPLPPATGSADEPDFISELRDLINRRSMENASNTPDFILAQYLTNCLRAWNQATQQRETWYGRDARPTCPPNEKLRHGEKETHE